MACSISVLLFFSKSKCLFWRQKSISVGSDMDENPAKNNAKQLILYVLSMSSGHLIAVVFLDFLPSQPECQVGPRNEPASNMSNLSQLALNIVHYLAKCWCLSTAHQIPVPPNQTTQVQTNSSLLNIVTSFKVSVVCVVSVVSVSFSSAPSWILAGPRTSGKALKKPNQLSAERQSSPQCLLFEI